MTNTSGPQDMPDNDVEDQDSEPTMTAPPGERPDGLPADAGSSDGRADSPDAVDADDGENP